MATSATLKTKTQHSRATISSKSALANSNLYSLLANIVQVIRSRAILIVLVAALTYLLSSAFTITILSSTVNLSVNNEQVKAAIVEAQNSERSLQVRFSAASSLDEIRRYAISKHMGMIEAHVNKQLPIDGLEIIAIAEQ